MKFAGAVLLAALVASALATKSYEDYKLIRTAPVPASKVEQLVELQQSKKMDFWTGVREGKPVDIMLHSRNLPMLSKVLKSIGIKYTVIMRSVGDMITKQRAENDRIKQNEMRSSRAVTFDRFMDYDEIMAYLHETIAANPAIATLEDLATSFEGRMVHGIKISNGPGKKAVWMDCAIHAREWAAPPVCMKVIEEVIASTELQDLADWYILPVGNPDGYSFTWTDDRMWRKTRMPNAGSLCVGTDPNRNFDFEWNANNNNNPCSDTYPGTRPFDQPETLGISDRVTSLGQAGQFMLYLTVHSYGQIFYYPYGTTATPAPTATELQAAGDAAAAALKAVRGTVYEVYSESRPSGFIYGAMDDYSYDVATIPYSYTMELPSGGGGFVLPPSEIQPVVDESWAGIEAMVRHIAALM